MDATTKAYLNLWQYCDQEGYKILSVSPEKWKGILKIAIDPRDRSHRKVLAVVYNKGNRNKVVIAGIFQDIREARKWKKENYYKQRIFIPIVKTDELTSEVTPMLEREKRAISRYGSLGARVERGE